MAEWKHFPLWDARPTGIKTYTETERTELELIISIQTASLLAQYAVAEQIEVDNGGCTSVDESQSFYALSVDPFALEDDGELVVQQAPYLHDAIDVSEGLHCIERSNEDGVCNMGFAVWDPDIDTDHRILDESGKVIDL